MRLSNKTTREQQKQARLKIQFFWKDKINIKKQLLWTQTANYIRLFFISNQTLHVDEYLHY